MKNRVASMSTAVTLATLALLLCSTQARADEEPGKQQQIEAARAQFQRAVAANRAGNHTEAILYLRRVLKFFPNHPQARLMLAVIDKQKGQGIFIPQIALNNAGLDEALEVLAAKIKHVIGNDVCLNFLIHDPKGVFKGRIVGFQPPLDNIPAHDVLKFIVDQVRGKIQFHEHAIIISPLKAPMVPPPPQPENLTAIQRMVPLSDAVIAEMMLDDLSLHEALEILKLKIRNIPQNKGVPNFIVQDPGGDFKGDMVSLHLKNVPADDLLHYIVWQVGGKIRYDKHAIVINPR